MDLGDKIRAGQDVSRKRGIRIGRPVILEPHKDDIERLVREGVTISDIAKQFHVARSTVQRFISTQLPIDKES